MTISVKNLNLVLNNHPVLHNVSFTLQKGTLTGITGPNGSGKSTLLKALCGELRTGESSINLGTNNGIAYLPQDLEDPPFLTVAEVVDIGFYATKNLDKDSKTKRASELLKLCGIETLACRSFSDLSAGEKKRVWLAFILAQDKEVIALDEPFSSIDSVSRRGFYQLVRTVVDTGKTVLLVSHDNDLIENYADEILMLDKGHLVNKD